MAGDYGLDSGGNVVIQQPATSGNGPATRLTGGGNGTFSGFAQNVQAPQSNFGAMADTSLKTLDALNKLTNGIINPMIEREQKQQYYEGMGQVAQGKTLLEVQKEQPWYTKIFGPSASVQGAQAMTLMNTMNQAESDFYTHLPELREKSPDEARQWLTQQFSLIGNTGDPGMDAMVQAKLAEGMYPMLNQHMKQHLAYVQEQNDVAFGNGVVTSNKALQDKTAQRAFWNKDELAAQDASFVASLQPMPGMTPEAWQKNIVKGFRASMMDGNFAGFEAFKKSELWNKLPVDFQDHLEKQVLPYATEWNQKNNPTYLDRWMDQTALHAALVRGAGPQSQDQLMSWVSEQNAKYKVQTGSSQPLYDNQAISRMEAARLRGEQYLAAQQAKAVTVRNKAIADKYSDIQQQAAVGWSMNSGLYNPALDSVTPENAQAELSKRWDDVLKSGDPDKVKTHLSQLSAMSTYGSKLVDKNLQMRWTSAAQNFLTQGVPVSDTMRASLQHMQMMEEGSNGVHGLSTYIGGDAAAKMVAFIKSGVDLGDQSAVDRVRQSIMRGWGAPVTAKIKKSVDGWIADNDTFMQKYLPLGGPGAVSGYSLNDASKARLGSLLAPQAARYAEGLGIPLDTAMPLAFSTLFGNSGKVDYVDGSFTEPTAASGNKSMFSVVAADRGLTYQGDEDYQQALKNVINNTMGTTIGKVPLQPKKDLTVSEKFGNTFLRTANNLIDTVAEGNKPFNDKGKWSPDPTVFDPDAYVTGAVMPVSNGVLEVTRLPKKPSFDMRSVTVTITAAQVEKELDEVVKQRRATASKMANVPVFSDKPEGMINPQF